jgi:peptide-methionine (R)-S-oxide reductase
MLLLFIFLFAVKMELTENQWRETLGPERYHVMRLKGTEPAFSGEYLDEKGEGIYTCAACAQPLFDSHDKFNLPGCGWPLFKQPIESKNIYYEEDWNMGFKRYEVLCRSCESHLGHVFKDGPPPKYFRYTINSLSLLFLEKKG